MNYSINTPTFISCEQSSANPDTLPQSFHGKRFKLIRVVSDGVVSLIKSISYRILSLLSLVACQKDTFNHLSDLSTYYADRSFNRLYTYILYGNKVINFSMNSTGIPIDSSKINGNNLEQLRNIYGELFDEMQSKVSTESHIIDEEKLSLHPINKGVCLGASLDFISRYLKGNQLQTSTLIEKISALFSERGTAESQILHILQYALKKESDCYSEEEKKYKENLIIERHNGIDNTKKIRLFGLKLKAKKYSSLANACGFRIESTHIDEYTTQKKPSEAFITNFSNLSDGAYLISINNSEIKKGHAMAMIKVSENEIYLFDPNRGTLKFEDQNEFNSKFWSLIDSYYNTRSTFIGVYSCTPFADA